MTDLARPATASLVQLSFDNDSSPDPCADEDSHQVACALTGPQHMLADHADVHVVVHQHRNAQQRPELCCQRHFLPAQVRSRMDNAALVIDRSRRADAHGPDLGALESRALPRLLDEFGDVRD